MENHGQREEIREALTGGSGSSARYSETLTEKMLYQAVRLTDGSVLRISGSQKTVWMLVLGMLHAVIVDETDMDSDKVSIGCRVTVTNLDNGKTLPEYTIVGSQEANVMERKVSEDSPFGKALMGSKAGSEITVEAPKGVIRYRVDKIER